MNKKTILIMALGCLVILCLMCLVAAGVGVYFYKNNVTVTQTPFPTIKPSLKPSISLELPSPTLKPSPQASLKTYSNPTLGITFKYPSDWSVEEYVDGSADTCYTTSIYVSSGEYSFEYYKPCASGIAVCLYEDSNSYDYPEYIQFNSYVPIKNSQKDARRSYEIENNVWYVCVKDDITGNYLSNTAGGDVYYYAPESPDPIKLDQMDKILLSLEPIN
jgi:hypothetical protein